MSRSTTAALAAAVVTAWLASACVSGLGDGEQSPDSVASGPLRAQPPHTSYFEVKEGEVFSDGLEIISVPQRATVESITVEGAGDALEFLGARLGLPGRPDDFNQRMAGFPPSDVPKRLQIAAEGANLKPNKTYMLILGFRVLEPVLALREGITVEYTIDGTPYAQFLPARMVTCPPPLTDSKCARRHPDGP